MAKDTVDLACEKLGKAAECRTHRLTLAGADAAPRPDFPRPSKPLKLFLRKHPRLRELHALMYLGMGLAGRLAAGGAPPSTAAAFRKHYSL